MRGVCNGEQKINSRQTRNNLMKKRKLPSKGKV